MLARTQRRVPPRSALPKGQSAPGFSNLRVRALPRVDLRSLGSRPSSLRGRNGEFYINKNGKKIQKRRWALQGRGHETARKPTNDRDRVARSATEKKN